MKLNDIRLIEAEDIARLSPFPALIEALDDSFRNTPTAPTRAHYAINDHAGSEVTLLSMTAWQQERYIGQKLVSVVSANAAKGLETVCGIYVLLSAETGLPLAFLDAAEMTARRTAAASALAAKYLVPEDAETFLLVGTGKLAPYMIEAHLAARSYKKIQIWGRSEVKANAVKHALAPIGMEVEVADDLEAACRGADVISCVTTSTVPIVKGDWLKNGVHLDLVGAFKPNMRETDDEAMARSSIFVDTFEGALKEGGDIVQPLDAGAITRDHIKADLSMLSKGDHKGRHLRGENTVFKSTGTAIEDYALAGLVYDRLLAGEQS
ncbi:ornithine cyclodeaminase family protein [Kordiimonas sp. SCSIO 12610]|uniref:ornithine cyclodeaminase family protein n=1 Tax=Kordiimonas sp. SCSIO 12610 TaxID=2829597 RepID=UPI00210A1577|nr:ornithine cyclodeaminase family protein [Kordiimonas sp. SCSIO 12610]UTW55923.1 ornithine cyclodeaminase family protein [Kordiimonas sp. SCSIO 12610]